MHEIKVLQNKGVFLHMFGRASSNCLPVSQVEGAHAACAGACVCDVNVDVRACLHLKAISGFRSNGV